MDKNENIFFSVLIANYNNSHYIEESICSVFNQTYPFWEIIIIDDCSTDNSIHVIQKYLVDRRIKLMTHKINRGYGAALRTAARYAKNDVIAILDSDDKLNENALIEMARAYKMYPNYGFIYSTHWICDNNLQNPKINKTIRQVDPGKTSLLERHRVISHFKTFKKEIYDASEGFDIRRKVNVDQDIIFRLEEITPLMYLDKPLYYYRLNNQGISKKKRKFSILVRYEGYLSKLYAYRRRINTTIPNLTKKQLNIEYYKIMIFPLTNLILKMLNTLQIFKILKTLKIRFPNTSKRFFRLIYDKFYSIDITRILR